MFSRILLMCRNFFFLNLFFFINLAVANENSKYFNHNGNIFAYPKPGLSFIDITSEAKKNLEGINKLGKNPTLTEIEEIINKTLVNMNEFQARGESVLRGKNFIAAIMAGGSASRFTKSIQELKALVYTNYERLPKTIKNFYEPNKFFYTDLATTPLSEYEKYRSKTRALSENIKNLEEHYSFGNADLIPVLKKALEEAKMQFELIDNLVLTSDANLLPKQEYENRLSHQKIVKKYFSGEIDNLPKALYPAVIFEGRSITFIEAAYRDRERYIGDVLSKMPKLIYMDSTQTKDIIKNFLETIVYDSKDESYLKENKHFLAFTQEEAEMTWPGEVETKNFINQLVLMGDERNSDDSMALKAMQEYQEKGFDKKLGGKKVVSGKGGYVKYYQNHLDFILYMFRSGLVFNLLKNGVELTSARNIDVPTFSNVWELMAMSYDDKTAVINLSANLPPKSEGGGTFEEFDAKTGNLVRLVSIEQKDLKGGKKDIKSFEGSIRNQNTNGFLFGLRNIVRQFFGLSDEEIDRLTKISFKTPVNRKYFNEDELLKLEKIAKSVQGKISSMDAIKFVKEASSNQYGYEINDLKYALKVERPLNRVTTVNGVNSKFLNGLSVKDSFDDFFAEFFSEITYKEFLTKYKSKRASEIVKNMYDIWLRLQTFSQVKNIDEMYRYRNYMDTIFKSFIGYSSSKKISSGCKMFFENK